MSLRRTACRPRLQGTAFAGLAALAGFAAALPAVPEDRQASVMYFTGEAATPTATPNASFRLDRLPTPAHPHFERDGWVYTARVDPEQPFVLDVSAAWPVYQSLTIRGPCTDPEVVLPGHPGYRDRHALVASICEGLSTDEERAMALFNFVALSGYHQHEYTTTYPVEWLQLYGYGFCGTFSNVFLWLLDSAGLPWLNSNAGWHGTAQVEFDYGLGLLDTYFNTFWLSHDNRRLCSMSDLAEDHFLLARTGDYVGWSPIKGWQLPFGYYHSTGDDNVSTEIVTGDRPPYRANLVLSGSMSLVLHQHGFGKFRYDPEHIQSEPVHYGSGALTLTLNPASLHGEVDASTGAVVSTIRSVSLVRAASAGAIAVFHRRMVNDLLTVGGTISLSGRLDAEESTVRVDVSPDGVNWQPACRLSLVGDSHVSASLDALPWLVDPERPNRYDFWLRGAIEPHRDAENCGIACVTVALDLAYNARIVPWLENGRNERVLKTADQTEPVELSWAWDGLPGVAWTPREPEGDASRQFTLSCRGASDQDLSYSIESRNPYTGVWTTVTTGLMADGQTADLRTASTTVLFAEGVTPVRMRLWGAGDDLFDERFAWIHGRPTPRIVLLPSYIELEPEAPTAGEPAILHAMVRNLWRGNRFDPTARVVEDVQVEIFEVLADGTERGLEIARTGPILPLEYGEAKAEITLATPGRRTLLFRLKDSNGQPFPAHPDAVVKSVFVRSSTAETAGFFAGSNVEMSAGVHDVALGRGAASTPETILLLHADCWPLRNAAASPVPGLDYPAGYARIVDAEAPGFGNALRFDNCGLRYALDWRRENQLFLNQGSFSCRLRTDDWHARTGQELLACAGTGWEVGVSYGRISCVLGGSAHQFQPDASSGGTYARAPEAFSAYTQPIAVDSSLPVLTPWTAMAPREGGFAHTWEPEEFNPHDWHEVSHRWRAEANGVLSQIWLDGELKSEEFLANAPRTVQITVICIGMLWTGKYRFSGLLDEVRLTRSFEDDTESRLREGQVHSEALSLPAEATSVTIAAVYDAPQGTTVEVFAEGKDAVSHRWSPLPRIEADSPQATYDTRSASHVRLGAVLRSEYPDISPRLWEWQTVNLEE